METLHRSRRFDFVEPDYVVHAQLSPSDTAFTGGLLWGLQNNGAGGGLPGADIRATDAWEITTGSTNVIVAVVDTGIRYTHQDLAAQMWRNPGEIPGNGVDDDQNGYVDDVYGINAIMGSGDPNDDQGHGTHLAGTIGAAANDGNPHIGVTWQVRLVACKFLDTEGNGYTSDAIEAINYAIANGARIINASWGGDDYSQALFNVISNAATRDVLFIAAAGNDGADKDSYPSYPGNYALDNVITVAALNREDKLAAFSNYGQHTVHLGAPGVQIYSTTSGSDVSYAWLDGTSMAVPHVTGTAALLLARYPSATALELRQRLLTTVSPIPALFHKTATGGRLNAFSALDTVADGKLEVGITPYPGTRVVVGKSVALRVRITDLIEVTNAAVIALDESGNSYSLLDNGVGPDGAAGDATYGGFVPVPTTSSNLDLTLAIVAPGKESKVTPVHYQVLFAPDNDDFSSRVELAGTAVSVAGSNLGATREEGEPRHTILNAGGSSVWWSWQSPEDGILTVDTDGSDFDTLLAVYLGSSLADLNSVANDDDGGENGCSSLSFSVVRGQTYQIAVDGFSGDSGRIQLNLSFIVPPPPPANDVFTDGLVLYGISNRVSGSNISASKEPGEPRHAGNIGGRSVWWAWTAPASGNTKVTTDHSNFDTALAVYTGVCVSNLVTVVSDDDSGTGFRSLLTFEAIAGTTYHIAVDGHNGAFGRISLSVVLDASPAAPTNDDFVNAAALSGTDIQLVESNRGATKESGEPDHAENAGGKSLWWSWTAPAAGRTTITTAGSDFDTLLAVYEGDSLTNLSTVAGNNQDPMGGLTSRVGFEAVAGNYYYIAVDGNNKGFGAADGNIVLHLSLEPLPASATNDQFCDRMTLTDPNNTITAYNGYASREVAEPLHANKPGGKSLWWTWTAPSHGRVVINTDGSDFDTLLAVYTGDSLPNLFPVASDDDSGQGLNSLVDFRAMAGDTYQIAVDGYRGAFGQIRLYLLAIPDPPPPVNDDYANRIPITDLSQTILGTTLGATREPGEPYHASQTNGHSVWWTWTAPTNALLLIDTEGSDFNATLSAYTGNEMSNLVLLADNNDMQQGARGQVSFQCVAGECYHIAVDGIEEAMGNIQLHLALTLIQPPTILIQPHDQLTDAGGIAAITVKASSPVSPSYQWQRNGVALTNDGIRVFGATAEQLILLNVQGCDVGDYTVRICNSAGSVVSTDAVLRVNTTFRLEPNVRNLPPESEFSFQMGGQVGLNYRLEWSSNLINWSSLGIFPNSNGVLQFMDSGSITNPMRFYRAVLPTQ